MKTSTLVGITLGIAVAIVAFFSLIALCTSDEDVNRSQTENTQETTASKDAPGAPGELPQEQPPVKAAKVVKNVSTELGKPFSREGVLVGDPSAIKETKMCTGGVLVDLTTRKILWEKNANTPLPIASMTKIMTTLMVLEAIEKNANLSFDTLVPVSRSASKIGGSQVFLADNEIFKLDALFQGMIIHSANDCAELLAELVADGSAKKFVELMNQRAKELGCKKTTFYSAHGLPKTAASSWKGDNVASPMDMALLAEALMQYPKAMEYSKQLKLIFRPDAPLGTTWRKQVKMPDGQVFSTNEIIFENSNKILLKTAEGCDGMKTGFTQKAKFCVTATCNRNGHRLIAVVTGVEYGNSKRDDRAKIVRALFNYGAK